MTDSTPGAPAGWYPIAPGSTELRWWDGSQWTEYRHTTEQRPYAPNTPLVAPEGTNPTTVWAWLLVFTPLVSLVGLLQWDIKSYLRATLSLASSTGTNSDRVIDAVISPSYLAFVGLGLLTFVLTVLFAVLDFTALKKRGVPRPFHWAWSLLETGAVYMIGRAVVVRRRTGHGLTPLWVWIGVWVLVFVVSLVVFFSALAELAPLIARYSGSYSG